MTLKKKAYQDLTFADDFMFCNIMQNNLDICKDLVELMVSADSWVWAFYRTYLLYATQASQGKTQVFHRTTSGFTLLALRLPFGLRFATQSRPPFSLISSFCS